MIRCREQLKIIGCCLTKKIMFAKYLHRFRLNNTIYLLIKSSKVLAPLVHQQAVLRTNITFQLYPTWVVIAQLNEEQRLAMMGSLCLEVYLLGVETMLSAERT